MILKERVEQALRERKYLLLNETDKKRAFQREGDLPVYLNRTAKLGETALVIHPDHQAVEAARQINGLRVGDAYYHSSNLGLFPRRMNKGKTPIAYGWGLTFESETALQQLLALLEGIPALDDGSSSPEVSPLMLPGRDVDMTGTRRVGQSDFRLALLKYWKSCAVTDLACEPLLRASHIVPWIDATPDQKTDVFNGLLLAPHLDAAFDSGYISFDDDGTILISPKLSGSDLSILGLHPKLRLKRVHASHAPYLALHRAKIFQR